MAWRRSRGRRSSPRSSGRATTAPSAGRSRRRSSGSSGWTTTCATSPTTGTPTGARTAASSATASSGRRREDRRHRADLRRLAGSGARAPARGHRARRGALERDGAGRGADGRGARCGRARRCARAAAVPGPRASGRGRGGAEVGLGGERLYVTNAVKHFKFVERGKRRIHQTPRLGELAACRPWMEAEIAAIKPEVLVCLGATAARAIFGPDFRLLRDRGRFLRTRWSEKTIATLHPSAVLRG